MFHASYFNDLASQYATQNSQLTGVQADISISIKCLIQSQKQRISVIWMVSMKYKICIVQW